MIEGLLAKVATENAPLSPEMLKCLLRKAQKGSIPARDKVILTHLRFLVSVALKKGKGMHLEDLCQAGVMGLMKAIEDFDFDRKTSFLTYAKWWVECYVSRELLRQKRLIWVPYRTQLRACHEGRPIPERILEVKDNTVVTRSTPEEAVIREEVSSSVSEALEKLPKRLKLVLELRYGLPPAKAPMTYRDMGKVIGVSYERARQLCVMAAEQFRRSYGSL